MASFNKVILVGNLARDPERRSLPSGTPLADLRLAVSRRYTLPSGESKEETLFISVTVFGKQAETVIKYMKKGRPILIEGRLRQEEWTNKDGQKQSRISVVAEQFRFLGDNPNRGGGAEIGDAPEGVGYGRRAPAPPERETPPERESPLEEEAPPEGGLADAPSASAGKDDENLPF